MKTLLICHEGAELDQKAMPRWLASFSDLSGIVIIRENRQRLWKRIRREIKRTGGPRFLDVLAMRFYYRCFMARRDRLWERRRAAQLCSAFPGKTHAPVLYTHSPNSPEAEAFIRGAAPDVMIARCKTLLKRQVFSIPTAGTFVLHPGVCPEYRNAHGCFWALAQDDLEKVGMTLLRIDEGVDTGPVFGYFTYDFDPVSESHAVIQHRVTYDNLVAIRDTLIRISQGGAERLNIAGRASATWGQPWFSAWVRLKRRARRRARMRSITLLYHDVIEPGDFTASGFLTPGANRYKLEKDEFARQLKAIAASSPVRPSTILDFPARQAPSSQPLLLTFDDGGASAFTLIAGALEEYGWRGHFFITTGAIGKPGFMTASQIRQLHERGHVIGSHSATHPLKMSACSAETLFDEWASSVSVLSDLLGERVTVASIPGGFYSRRAAEIAALCGIRVLFTSEPTRRVWRVSGCQVFGRFSLVHGSSPDFTAALAAGRAAPQIYQRLSWDAKKIAKAAGGGAYSRMRNHLTK